MWLDLNKGEVKNAKHAIVSCPALVVYNMASLSLRQSPKAWHWRGWQRRCLSAHGGNESDNLSRRQAPSCCQRRTLGEQRGHRNPDHRNHRPDHRNHRPNYRSN
ncbi:uncharacterized protein MYCFIDRAFT_175548 [Pseudocercospora fijiensis CIRAD86]|uniref:Uncharacterized protein n=1 Tax=Pseudocercospora fijiensis (strain CIRAD86) TaxID=383855 RepID=M3ABM4_PSEFD|nr:uncharacterized protein MYCFIDRAFT_175548 [Pseudocercospora fijiensis CIRAD86]EME81981.1 hypothetical protein MYCFIDRAFT_175548 [Pseudocercospora fijiensis CIRAD86]